MKQKISLNIRDPNMMQVKIL